MTVDRPLPAMSLAVVGALLLLVLGGCDRRLSACEDALREVLKAPATLRIISADRSGNPDWFTITYEAQNPLGVPLRETGECYVYPDGRAVFTPKGQYK